MDEGVEMVFKVRCSPTVGKLAEAMAKAQEEMGAASKDSTNPHFKNKYASLASCFEAIKPMHKNGLAVLQPPMPHGLDGVCVQTLVIHASGEWLVGELYMPAGKKDAQGFGSALTYARRYCLCSTVGLATEDDDAQSASKPVNDTKPVVPANDVDTAALEKALKEAKDAKELAAAALAVSKVKDKLSPGMRDALRGVHDERLRELAA